MEFAGKNVTEGYAPGICDAFQEMIGTQLTPALSFQTGESSSVLSAGSLGHEYEYMIGKIGLEEHFAIPETLQDSAGFVPGDYWIELSRRLLDIQDDRLRQMDDNGMEMMVLSLNAPAVQAISSPLQANKIAVLAGSDPGQRAERSIHVQDRNGRGSTPNHVSTHREALTLPTCLIAAEEKPSLVPSSTRCTN
jgi:hypothetical protein